MSIRIAFAVSVAIAALTGCTTGQDMVVTHQDLPVKFKNTVDASHKEAFDKEWWKALNDQQLNDLVAKALVNNSDVKVATGQIMAAEAVLKGSNASFFPVFDLSVDGSRGRQATGSSGSAGADYPMVKSASSQIGVKYELDLWGRLSDISAANQYAVEASNYDKQAIELTVMSGVVNGYLSLRQSDQLIQQYIAILKNAEENASFVERSLDAGLSTNIDLQASQTQVRDSRASLLKQQAERDITENALALLVGDQSVVVKPSLSGIASRLPVPNEGLTSSLLASRPDVLKADAALSKAKANVSVAKKAFFPQISLTGAVGSQTSAFSTLMGAGSKIWSAGYGLDLPIFDGGLRVSNLWTSRAEQDIALAQYKNAIQTSFGEVNDAIVTLNSRKRLLEDAEFTSESAKKVLAMQEVKFNGGILSYKELVAEDSAYRQKQILAIQSRFDYLNAWVSFNKSLGIGI